MALQVSTTHVAERVSLANRFGENSAVQENSVRAATKGTRPCVCFVGPMVGRNPGYVTTQGEILSDRFAEAGYAVISVSSSSNRYVRLFDILFTLIRAAKRYHVICLQVFSGPSFVVEDLASIVGLLLRKPIVMILRGGAMPDFAKRNPTWVRTVFRRAKLMIAPSRYLAETMSKFASDIKVIPNIVDLSNYQFKVRTQVSPRLLWMRAFYDYYEPEMAVRVLAEVRKTHPQATLTMCGQDKGLLAKTQQLVRDLRVESAVSFGGFLDMKGKQREFLAHDVFLSTNSVDNMPVSVVEAAAFGLPVVAASVGGIPYLLKHEETGMLTPVHDVSAMAAAVRRLVDEPALAQRLSCNGRKLAEESDWSNVFPKWEEIFQQTLRKT